MILPIGPAPSTERLPASHAGPRVPGPAVSPRIHPLTKLRIGPASPPAGPWRRGPGFSSLPPAQEAYRDRADPFLANPYPSVTGAASLVAAALGLAIVCMVMVLIGAPL